MAHIIKIKRSDVASKIPLLTDLELGELAMNTTDGKLFMKKNSDGVETIVEIGRIPNSSAINSGIAFPATATTCELFFRTDLNALYLYDNTTWSQVGVQQVISDHINDYTRHLTASQNALLDGLSPDISSTHINFLATVTSPVQDQFNNRVVKTGDTMSGPLTLPGKPVLANQAATKQYVDDFQPFINLPPRAGYPSKQSSTSEVPVYADFKFSRKVSFSPAPCIVDSEDRTVIYWPCVQNYNTTRCFQSFGYSTDQQPVYNNIPVHPAALTATQQLIMAYSAGTYYLDGPCQDPTSGDNKRLLFKTNGSSDPSTWTESFNLTENTSEIGISFNAGYAYEHESDRIIRLSFEDSTNRVIMLQIFDMQLKKVGPARQLFDINTDVDFVTGANGRVIIGFAFAYLAQTISLAYDSVNEILYSCNAITVNTTLSDGSSPNNSNAVLTIAYHIPKSVFVTGAGDITNINPPHVGNNYQYWMQYQGSPTNGLYPSFGLPINLSYDSYYNALTVDYSSGWETGINNQFFQLSCKDTIYKTITPYGSNTPTYQQTLSLPDASPWAKSVFDDIILINDTMQFIGANTQNGFRLQTKIYVDQIGESINSFSALKMVPNTWVDIYTKYPKNVYDLLCNTAAYTAVVSPDGNSVKNYVLSSGDLNIYEITTDASGTWIPIATGVKLPVVPGGNYWYGPWTWNGNKTNPVFYYMIVWGQNPNNANELDYPKIMTWQNGTFSVNPTTPGVTNWNSSAGTYGDKRGRLHRVWTMMYSESGNVLCGTSTLHALGGAFGATISKLTPAGDIVDCFNCNPYGGYQPHIGYHPTFGYYTSAGSDPTNIATLLTSKYPGQTGQTEAQFLAGPIFARYITISATVGLVAYVTAFPIFLGGYYSMIPNLSVSLTPNANNYIYLRRDPSDRTNIISMVLIDQELPNSFSRVLIAKVVTDGFNVISSINYQV